MNNELVTKIRLTCPTETGAKHESQHRVVLHSWKEIAEYLRLGIRTVQRYEALFSLPVRRPGTSAPAHVFAFSDELDAWLSHRPTREAESPMLRTECAGFLASIEDLVKHAERCTACSSRLSDALAKKELEAIA